MLNNVDGLIEFRVIQNVIETLHYIETGSLISIKEHVKDILIPSEEDSINIYPMDYEEFLTAGGYEEMSSLIRLCFEKREPLG